MRTLGQILLVLLASSALSFSLFITLANVREWIYQRASHAD